MQVIEDDGRFRVAVAEHWGDLRRLRHFGRQVRRRAVDETPEASNYRIDVLSSLRRIPRCQESLVQRRLQPVVRPDQAVICREALAERQRILLALHQIHVLRLRAEGETGARLVVANQRRYPRVLRVDRNAVVSPHIVNLAMEHVGPVEHRRYFGCHLLPFGRNRGFVEWYAWRMPE